MNLPFPMPVGAMFNGLEVIIDRCVPGRWQFPKDRFIEYEPKDEWWCRKYGYGREVFDQAYRVGNTIVMHPIMWKELKKHMAEADRKKERDIFGVSVPGLPRSFL